MRREHALVDDHFRREADEEQQSPLGERLVAAQAVRGRLADGVELALERIRLSSARRLGVRLGPVRRRRLADKQLLDHRHGGAGGGADVGLVRANGHLPPAEQALAGYRHFLGDHRLATLAFRRVSRQEDDACAIAARCRQVDAEIGTGDLGEEPVRQRGQHPRAVAGVLLVAQTAAMHHAAVHALRRRHDVAARPTLDVAHEADPAGVLLEGGVVEPLAVRQAEGQLVIEVGHGQAVKHRRNAVG